MIEPTRPQAETLARLTDLYARVEQERCAPIGAQLYLARCFDGHGHQVLAVYVYADGRTRMNSPSVAPSEAA